MLDISRMAVGRIAVVGGRDVRKRRKRRRFIVLSLVDGFGRGVELVKNLDNRPLNLSKS
jgi:hypothetical protein